MSGKTSIEWTEHTWNPIVGCSIVSPGCTNCYAMKMAARIEAMGNQPRYDGTTRKVNGNAIWTGKLALAPEATLLQPLKRRVPTTYFVNSMGDLFHEDCPDEWIDKAFAVMALAPQHTFQVLTKRARRMRDYMTRPAGNGKQDVRNHLAWITTAAVCNSWYPDWKNEDIDGPCRSRAIAAFTQWPLPNVWLGVSAERQQEANERIPDLLRTPAAVRFVSAEPLLGHIAFHALNLATPTPSDALRGVQCVPDDSPSGFHNEPMAKLDWVIVGGESGHGARPMDPEWARTIRDWCQATNVPYFFKQWGSHVPETRGRYRKVPKSVAGRLLDGIEHNAMPEVLA
jgi:protein gp37